MSKEFEVNENGTTMEGYKTLHPKMKKAMRLGGLIYLVFSLVITVLVGWLAYDVLAGFYWPILSLMLLLTSYFVISTIVFPVIFYARYRYNVSEDRIDVLRGVFIIRHVVVPVERIHQIEVTRGPIKNFFGLANVTMTTAGGTASIEYLELPEAEGIANKLNEKVVKILKERE